MTIGTGRASTIAGTAAPICGAIVSLLERGFETLDAKRLAGATVTVEFYGLTPDKDFAKEFLVAWLQAHQVQVVTDPKEAQLRVKVFAPVLGVDQAQSFMGTPTLAFRPWGDYSGNRAV